MAGRRSLLIVTATVVALLLVALLAWASYRSIRHDESARLEQRQQALAGTIAVAIGSEIVAHRTQLQQLNRLPSIHYLAEDTLPGRLADLFSGGPVSEIVVTTADDRTRSWAPGQSTLAPRSAALDRLRAPLMDWARDPANRQRTYAAVLDRPDGADLVLSEPTYQTSLGGPGYRSPSGAFVGALAFRLDVAALVSRYVTHVLERAPDSAVVIVAGPGPAVYAASGKQARRDEHVISAETWRLIEGTSEDSVVLESRNDSEQVASWARVPDAGLPLYVWLDQPTAVSTDAVWPLLMRQVPMFVLIALCVLALAWTLHRSSRSEARYRALFTQAADGIVVLAPEGTVIDVNPAASQALGLSRREAVGRAFSEFLSVDQLPDWHARLADARVGRPQRVDLTLTRRGGEEVPASVSLAVVATGRVLAVIRDVSDRRTLEMQLRQAHKMEAVGRLAGGVAHDFNNLLTAILGYNELILHQLPESDPRREDALELRRAAERAADLTQRLLAFGRRQMLEPRVFVINELVRGLERLLQRLVGSPVVIDLQLAPDIWRVDADPGRIEQVLINLAVNARDAMPDGGVLRIVTSNETLTGEAAQAAGLPEGDYVTLEVTDTGVGIPEDVRPHLFEPFFTTKPLGTGTGLGLPTVYGIVQQSGGGVDVHSEPGLGTTLRIRLPRTQRPVPESDLVSATADVPRGRATILLVEDEQSVRRLLSASFKALGYTVLEAADPLEAIALFEQHGDRIGLLMSDIVMPHMSGTALAERLRGLRPDLPIVLMSGYAMDAFDHNPAPAGALLLQKPFTTEAAARQIAELLAGQPGGGAAARTVEAER